MLPPPRSFYANVAPPLKLAFGFYNSDLRPLARFVLGPPKFLTREPRPKIDPPHLPFNRGLGGPKYKKSVARTPGGSIDSGGDINNGRG